MPSTVVHLALSILLAAGILGAAFDRRALAVVLAVTVFPDLDAFVGLVLRGGHRAAFHNIWIPVFAAGVLFYDTQVRSESWVRRCGGWRGPRVAWAAIAVYLVSAIGLDLVVNGVNLFYPFYDQFYEVTGRFFLSSERGAVQTFIEFTPGGGKGTTKDVHLSTGVDPTAGREEQNVERIFPVVWSGWQLLLVVASLLTLWARTRLQPPRQ